MMVSARLSGALHRSSTMPACEAGIGVRCRLVVGVTPMNIVLHHSDLFRRRSLGMAGALAAALTSSTSRATTLDERPDLLSLFSEHGTRGTFVLYDPGADRLTVVDRARAERRY